MERDPTRSPAGKCAFRRGIKTFMWFKETENLKSILEEFLKDNHPYQRMKVGCGVGGSYETGPGLSPVACHRHP